MSPLGIRGAFLAGNFAPGRAGDHPVDLIVVHVTEGDADSVVSWFNNPDANVSAHYLVRKDGTMLQFVSEDDTAWHAGRVSSPTAQLVIDRAPANPNSYSIGIEHEGDGKGELTELQRRASLALIVDICQRRTIPIDRTHIVGHHEIYAPKTCPGAISVDRLVVTAAALAESIRSAPTIAPVGRNAPRVVWSNYLNDYLVVTQFVDDTEWYYLTPAELATMRGHRAGTPLSKMPLRPAL